MADYADRVVTELVADTSGHDAKIRTSAQVVEQSATQIQRSANRAEAAIRSSSTAIVQSTAQIGQRTRLLGYQISDIGTQLASGTSPFIVLAQQGPQVANALEGATGVAGRMATFFSGPWGAAMLAAGTILGGFILKNRDTEESLEDLIRKLEEQGRKQDLARQAQEAYGRTVPGVIAAIREETEALRDQNRTLDENQRLTIQQAQMRRLSAVVAAAGTAGDLAAARAVRDRMLERAPRNAAGQVIESVELRAAQVEVARLEALLDSLNRSVALATQGVRDAQIPMLQRQVEGAMDGAAAATQRYEEALASLNQQLRTNQISETQYRERLTAAARTRDQQIEAARSNRREADGDLTSFNLPVQGRISSGIGPRGGRQHSGVDIAVPVGTQVGAAAGGTVIEAGNLPGYGNTVIIDHGRGTITRYAHLSQIIAQRGATVGQGDVIGLSGGAPGAPGAGNSRGPHVHYEVRRGGRAVNPLTGNFPTDPLSARRVSTAAQRVDPSDFMSSYLMGPSIGERSRELGAEGLERLDAAVAMAAELQMIIEDMPTLDDIMSQEASAQLQEFSEAFREDIAGSLAQAVVYGEDLGDALEGSLKRAAAALLESGLLNLLGMGGFGGGPFGALMSVLGIPGMASGGSFTVGGFGGIDRNVLSINGRPRARVSSSETVAVIPQGRAASMAAGSAAMLRPSITVISAPQFDLSNMVGTPELFREVHRVSQANAARAGAAAAQGALKAAPSRMGQFARDGR